MKRNRILLACGVRPKQIEVDCSRVRGDTMKALFSRFLKKRKLGIALIEYVMIAALIITAFGVGVEARISFGELLGF